MVERRCGAPARALAHAAEPPAGRYPVLIWLIPVALADALFSFGAAHLLEKAGLRVYRKVRS
jgi:hypothetical protein